MESLYVCLFSNGHIKVGRSIDPQSRMATHADRVACLGVELSDQFTVQCVGPAVPRESRLIAMCSESASRRFQSEWFEGLDFLNVCEWAQECATLDVDCEVAKPDSFGQRLRSARLAAGLTQAQLAAGLAPRGGDLMNGTVSQWECGRHGPNVNQLRLICERLGVSADSLVGLATKAE